MPKRILYAQADYEAIVRKNGYFVDKTAYIEKLERVENPIFLRPRRFGKTLLCRMLECYYNIRQQDEFEELFGHTWIGHHPTPRRNGCFVLHLDFSLVESGELKQIQSSFNHVCNLCLNTLMGLNTAWFANQVTIDATQSASRNLQRVMDWVMLKNLPPLYVIIDEYDNFANQLILGHQDHLYKQLIENEGFLKTFFKTLKEGRKTGSIQNIFITGVLPMAIGELTSAYNIGSFITLDPEFENMLGFTQAEVDALLDEIYHDYGMDPSTRSEIGTLVESQYDGYRFVRPKGEALYNATNLMYFLNWFIRYQTIPRHLTDVNLKTDLVWVKRLAGSNPDQTEEFVNQLILHNTASHDPMLMVSKFDISQFFEKRFFPITFFYLGLLTRQDSFSLRLPNLNMSTIFVEYFNELHQIDVSTRYTPIMRQFIQDLDVTALFTGYWKAYISQFPETIFQQVNENFYRTTFYELCSRYLSQWFTWNVERSYPQGRSDLEFVGKYHECFAGVRIVIAFKYYSNAEFKKLKTPLAEFQLQPEDATQLAGYVEGLRQEYPEARVSQYVIYCVGNMGFRVFEIRECTIPESNE